MQSIFNRGARAVALLATLTLAAPATAHPHVWITVRADVIIENGAASGMRHAWTFDKFYTEMAIAGLDANKDGRYDREELAGLAKVNMDGLKEFEYFTLARSNNTKLAFQPPSDYWLEHTNGILTLHFVLPLAQPQPVQGSALTFSIYDPTYFIAFEYAKDDPVRVEGAAAACTAALERPAGNTFKVVCGG